jgi:hypothetical protein
MDIRSTGPKSSSTLILGTRKIPKTEQVAPVPGMEGLACWWNGRQRALSGTGPDLEPAVDVSVCR